jgi:hypothetical protein
VRLPSHIRLAGLALIEQKLAEEIGAPTLGSLKAKKTKELMPRANITRVVSFPSS